MQYPMMVRCLQLLILLSDGCCTRAATYLENLIESTESIQPFINQHSISLYSANTVASADVSRIKEMVTMEELS